MNYQNLYREAVEAVRLGLLSIVYVPCDMLDEFRNIVSTMRGRELKLREIDFRDNTAEFRVLYTK